jgi:hypothetical protein
MENYREYIALGENESIVFADKAMNEITDKDALSDILLHLALFTNGQCLVKHYPKIVEMGIFYPCEIYIHADKNIAQRLIELIQKNYSEVNVNHLLICLSWIGTENVLEFFISSSNTKPVWTKELYVMPTAYADQAGWIFNSSNKKRNLINRKVIPFTKDRKLFDIKSSIETFIKHQEKCHFCKNSLIKLFAVELDSDEYKTEFSTCLLCGCYEPIYMTLDEKGNSKWHDSNKKWEHFSDDMEMEPVNENVLKVSVEQKNPEYSISQFVAISKSQIGGFPTWVQDAEYLDCPNCKEKMNFIGQIDMEDVEDYGEGIYYCHYCTNCKTTGTNYQQT